MVEYYEIYAFTVPVIVVSFIYKLYNSSRMVLLSKLITVLVVNNTGPGLGWSSHSYPNGWLDILYLEEIMEMKVRSFSN